MSAEIVARSGMPPPYCVGVMHENGRKRATCGTTALGLHLRGHSGGPERSRSRSRVPRRACTMAFGLHARGRLDASSRPVCAPGRDSRASHMRHNGLSVTPMRLRLTGPTARRQVAGTRCGQLGRVVPGRRKPQRVSARRWSGANAPGNTNSAPARGRVRLGARAIPDGSADQMSPRGGHRAIPRAFQQSPRASFGQWVEAGERTSPDLASVRRQP